MSVTCLKVTREDESIDRVKFMTVDLGTHLDVDVFFCDENFIPINEPAKGVAEGTEEDYHRLLRKEADHRGQLVREECTNPEWSEEE